MGEYCIVLSVQIIKYLQTGALLSWSMVKIFLLHVTFHE